MDKFIRQRATMQLIGEVTGKNDFVPYPLVQYQNKFKLESVSDVSLYQNLSICVVPRNKKATMFKCKFMLKNSFMHVKREKNDH